MKRDFNRHKRDTNKANKGYFTQQRHSLKAHIPPLQSKFEPAFHQSTTQDERFGDPQDRHYSVFRHMDTHTEEEHDHQEGFIKKQKWAAGGVVAVATLAGLNGTFSPTEATLLGATGAGNFVRNQGWWSAINKLPSQLGRIATMPAYTVSVALNKTSDMLLHGVFESNKRNVRKWARAKAKSITKDNDIKRKSIESIAENSPQSGLSAYLTKMRVNLALKAHRVNNAPSYALSKGLSAFANSIVIDKSAKGLFERQTRGLRRWMKVKSDSIHADNKIKRKAINDFVRNPIGKDIAVSGISSIFLGAGALVHVPQTKMGWDIMQQTGDLNGHLLGAGGVGIAYGLLAINKGIEISRLKDAYNTFKNISADQWDNRARHQLIGYSARGERMKQAIFVDIPLTFIIGKGVAYMYEASHLHNWSAESFTSIPEKISNFDANGALEYIKNTDVSGIAHAISHADYSTPLGVTASLTMLASGYIFAQSGVGEAIEEYGKQAKTAFYQNVKDPLNIKVDSIRYDLNDYFENRAGKVKKAIWDKAVRPVLKGITPQWVRAEPYYKEREIEFWNKATQSHIDLLKSSDNKNKSSVANAFHSKDFFVVEREDESGQNKHGYSVPDDFAPEQS